MAENDKELTKALLKGRKCHECLHSGTKHEDGCRICTQSKADEIFVNDKTDICKYFKLPEDDIKKMFEQYRKSLHGKRTY